MDVGLLKALNGLAGSPFWAGFGHFLSSPWMLAAVTGPLLVHLLSRRRFAAILIVALTMGATDAATARLIKPFIGRERPCRALPNLHTPDGCGPGRSFPSGHAAVSFAFLVSAAPLVPYGALIFAPLATLVAGSRILLGVHYPSDVLGGAIIGAAFGAAGHLLRRRIETKADA
ncbi:MAG: phosphatase PAP2 family protein [Deltaproteobacteria bacterium]|nr:phosphatase PAP2 family protein [Deltaproteobacteria bacterium]